jgi:hypothetical protein
MTIVTTYKAFAAAYPSGSRVPIVGPVKRTPKVCLPTKTVTVCAPASPAVQLVRQNAVSDDELTSQHALLDCVYSTKRSQEEETTKLWKVMHHPEWACHKEGDEFYQMGEYWVCDGKPSTPSAIIRQIEVDHKFVMRPRSTFGKNGKKLKEGSVRDLDELRYGVVTGMTTPADKRLSDDGWMIFKVDWDMFPSPLDRKYKNRGQKAITMQH